ncbi:MAG: nucleotide exchange factor GrpE [Candidatus Saccharibacteria bacterium]
MPHKTSPKPPKEDVTQLQQQLQDLTAALQRERADATNLRRRQAEEVSALRDRTKSALIRDLLPVIDNFERALKHVPAELADNDFVKGVQGVVSQFEATLTGLGVARIKTVGQPFNPHLHEAVSLDEGEGSEEIVSDELQAGYIMGDDVIRHAMVRVTTR